MQYTATSFKPGPNLNLIVGPNGAGKSSLVLAIALGLGGKPALFGRAKHLGEFVREGQDRATIKVEIVGRGGHGTHMCKGLSERGGGKGQVRGGGVKF